MLEKTAVKQVIYLSGITNDTKLSKHLLSRKNVEKTLSSPSYALTTFKAGIIVGSGSSSFEIIRDIVEKLPLMVAPKVVEYKNTASWHSRCIVFFTQGIKERSIVQQIF